MKELIQYLELNKIKFSIIDDYSIQINGKEFSLVLPDEEDLLFTEEFVLMAFECNCYGYVYKFGDNWYWELKEDVESPKLRELRYIGSSMSSIKTPSFLGIRGAYELLNGSRLYEDWCKKAVFLGCKALGICEKNTLAGALKFQLECSKVGIKPIFGATYTILRDKSDLRYDVKVYVKSKLGWRSLLLMNKEINVLNNKLIHEDRFLDLCEDVFVVVDPKSLPFRSITTKLAKHIDFYQLDPVEYINDDRDREYLMNLKEFTKSDMKPISITDAFYLEKEHCFVKKILNQMSGVREAEATNQYFKDRESYFSEFDPLFKPDDESIFDLMESAFANEDRLVSECNFVIDINQKFLPKYNMTEEESAQFENNEQLFWHLIKKGLEKVGNDEIYLQRIEKEFKVIQKGGFIDYFLILWDIIKFAQANKILSGIGRGSAGGSLIAYLLGIIKLNPLDFDLLFERFLNEGRIGSVENHEVYICSTLNGDIELDFKEIYPIFRGSKKMSVYGRDLQEGDQLIDFK